MSKSKIVVVNQDSHNEKIVDIQLLNSKINELNIKYYSTEDSITKENLGCLIEIYEGFLKCLNFI